MSEAIKCGGKTRKWPLGLERLRLMSSSKARSCGNGQMNAKQAWAGGAEAIGKKKTSKRKAKLLREESEAR